jgi:hypothetical protein
MHDENIIQSINSDVSAYNCLLIISILRSLKKLVINIDKIGLVNNMTKTFKEIFEESPLGGKTIKREYVEPTGIWVPSFWDTPESIARKEAEQRERFMNDLRNEFQEADEEREKQKKRIERLDELTQILRSRSCMSIIDRIYIS